MLIQACLNGNRRAEEHPALPITPHQLAHDAQLVVAKGAKALHIHPRNRRGEESLLAQDIAAALTAIRQSCPALPLGVSTGLWIEPDVSTRLQRVKDWTVLPDYASVNFSEPGTLELCQHLLSAGIAIEAGIWSLSDAQRLISFGLDKHCLRVLIELQEQEAAAARVTAQAIISYLDEANVQLPRLLHGDNSLNAWPMLDFALECGYDTRIGLEDTLLLPDGQLALDNAQLVELAVMRSEQRS